MYKQSPSRNHRQKGIKVKHILQICLLLAVCFWLIYQIKHSHEKSSEFDTADGKVVGKGQANNVIQRLGRKDLPRATELATDVEKHGEDEDEKEAEEEEEEENKHEEDDPEKEDNKHQEEVEGGRGDGDDEVEENENERADVEPEHEEESVDEDKEREENEEESVDGGSDGNHIENEENEDVVKEGHSEDEENEGAGKDERTEPEENEDFRKGVHNDNNNHASSEDQGHDGGDTNTHESGEEQYKADDASSEVAHEIQTIIPGTGNLTTGQAGKIWGKVNFGQGNETQTAEKDDVVVLSGAQPREMNHTITISEQKENKYDPNKSEDSPVQNSTLPIHLNDQPGNGANSTAIHEKQSAQSASLLSNGTHMELPLSFSQNATVEGGTPKEEHTSKSEFAKPGSNRTENVNSNAGEGAMPGEERNIKSQIAEWSSNKTEDVTSSAGQILNPANTTSNPSNEKNGPDAIAAIENSSLNAGEKSNNSGTSGSGESSKSHSHPSNENSDHVQDDPVNKPHESHAEVARESQTDSGGLPEIRNEVSRH